MNHDHDTPSPAATSATAAACCALPASVRCVLLAPPRRRRSRSDPRRCRWPVPRSANWRRRCTRPASSVRAPRPISPRAGRGPAAMGGRAGHGGQGRSGRGAARYARTVACAGRAGGAREARAGQPDRARPGTRSGCAPPATQCRASTSTRRSRIATLPKPTCRSPEHCSRRPTISSRGRSSRRRSTASCPIACVGPARRWLAARSIARHRQPRRARDPAVRAAAPRARDPARPRRGRHGRSPRVHGDGQRDRARRAIRARSPSRCSSRRRRSMVCSRPAIRCRCACRSASRSDGWPCRAMR